MISVLSIDEWEWELVDSSSLSLTTHHLNFETEISYLLYTISQTSTDKQIFNKKTIFLNQLLSPLASQILDTTFLVEEKYISKCQVHKVFNSTVMRYLMIQFTRW